MSIERVTKQETILPKIFVKTQGLKGYALDISHAIFENDILNLYVKVTSTEEEPTFIRECLQELTEFGFGSFEIQEGTP
jgi:hypothetical protein